MDNTTIALLGQCEELWTKLNINADCSVLLRALKENTLNKHSLKSTELAGNLQHMLDLVNRIDLLAVPQNAQEVLAACKLQSRLLCMAICLMLNGMCMVINSKTQNTVVKDVVPGADVPAESSKLQATSEVTAPNQSSAVQQGSVPIEKQYRAPNYCAQFKVEPTRESLKYQDICYAYDIVFPDTQVLYCKDYAVLWAYLKNPECTANTIIVFQNELYTRTSAPCNAEDETLLGQYIELIVIKKCESAEEATTNGLLYIVQTQTEGVKWVYKNKTKK